MVRIQVQIAEGNLGDDLRDVRQHQSRRRPWRPEVAALSGGVKDTPSPSWFASKSRSPKETGNAESHRSTLLESAALRLCWSHSKQRSIILRPHGLSSEGGPIQGTARSASKLERRVALSTPQALCHSATFRDSGNSATIGARLWTSAGSSSPAGCASALDSLKALEDASLASPARPGRTSCTQRCETCLCRRRRLRPHTHSCPRPHHQPEL